jgi:hypothetical protein
VVVVVVFFFVGRSKGGTSPTPISAPLDPYAANLVITNLQMSQSSNLAGGQLTYVDGQITNQGNRTLTGITVQILFHNGAPPPAPAPTPGSISIAPPPSNQIAKQTEAAGGVAQNETQELKFIRMREPYIDVEPVSASPLKPGASRDFRLIFESVAPGWDGAYPEIRIIHANSN